MGEDPARIRQEIEETRAEMSETVDALSYKTDVKARAKESVAEKRDEVKDSVLGVGTSIKEAIVGTTDSAKETIMGTTDSARGTAGGVRDRVSDATPDAADVKRTARRAVGIAQSNPLGLAIGSVAVGYLAGMLVPSTDFEDDKIGTLADDVKEKASELGSEALDRGKQVAQEAASSAQATVQEKGREQGQELASSAQDSAQDTAQTARTTVQQ